MHWSCRATAPAPVRLGIAAQQSPSQLLTYLARELGGYSRCGVTVELSEFPGSAKAVEALLGGSIDVVSGYHEQILQLPDGAPPLRSFTAMTNGLLVALAVSPAANGQLTSIEQLAGRKVGVTALGSATHSWLNSILRMRNLEENQVTPIAISTSSRALAAMERGVVDAGVVSDFTIRSLEARTGGAAIRILADTRTPESARRFYGVDQYPGAALFAPTAWLTTHPREARALACAISAAREWVRAHEPAEVAARLPESHKGGDPAIYTEVIRQTMAMLTPDGRISDAGAEAAKRLTRSSRPAADSFTNEFLDPPR